MPIPSESIFRDLPNPQKFFKPEPFSFRQMKWFLYLYAILREMWINICKSLLQKGFLAQNRTQKGKKGYPFPPWNSVKQYNVCDWAVFDFYKYENMKAKNTIHTINLGKTNVHSFNNIQKEIHLIASSFYKWVSTFNHSFIQ